MAGTAVPADRRVRNSGDVDLLVCDRGRRSPGTRPWALLMPGGGGADGGGELLQECAAGLVSVRRRDDGLLAFAAPDPVCEGPVEETLLAQVRSVFGITADDVVGA